MKIEQVVEKFLELLSQGKAEQAEELIVEEAKGREDEVAGYFLTAGINIGDEGYHFEALCCFEAARKVVKSEDLMGVIIQGLAIAHNNYGNLLKEMGKYEEAEFHYKESLRINPDYAEAYGNLGILYSDQKRYPEAIESFKSASHIFREKKMLLDHRKTEAFKSSVEARIFWCNESWEDTRRSLEEAIKNFSTCGMDYHAERSSSILYLLDIDESFIESLTPQDVLDLQERIHKLYKTIMEFKKDLEESEIYEHRIFAAKFTCIQFLHNALTFQPRDFEDLDNARKVLRGE